MANYLLTGGCGFIGSHIVDRLMADGHTVVIIDDLSTGSLQNLNSEAVFYKGSVSNKRLIEKVFSSHKFDAVFHEASHINTSVLDEDPFQDLEINVRGTLYLLESVLKHKIGKFIYASSVAVYGSPKKIPITELDPVKPIYSYGIAKRCAEEYIRYYSATRGINYHIARYGNVYGPRQPIYGEVGVIAIFTQRAVKNQPIVVFGDGEHIRDYIYIDDAVEATVRLLSLRGSDTFNVASGKGSTVNHVVSVFEENLGVSLEKKQEPERSNELGNFYCDVSKICGSLDWSPKFDLSKGVEATLKFYINRR